MTIDDQDKEMERGFGEALALTEEAVSDSPDELALRIARGMDWQELLDMGAGSCVASHGCDGVTQTDLIEFSRRLLAEQPMCSCGDSFTKEALCHNCVAGLSKTAEQQKQEPWAYGVESSHSGDVIVRETFDDEETAKVHCAMNGGVVVVLYAASPQDALDGMVMVPREELQAAAMKLETVGRIYDGDKQSRRLAELFNGLLAMGKDPK